ncbi:MAG: endonuclease domain-containing protein, partial [Deltaproteobacteria bacterium]|nr:endonuclease domain-containing protein [Deltaproteobacteria bacterium]
MKKKARRLKKNPTEAEHRLWRGLRGRQLDGHRFRRQYVVGKHIVDFVCLEKMLVIEVDGGQHAERREADARRTADLEEDDFQVLRFWNHDVLKRTEGVLEAILS